MSHAVEPSDIYEAQLRELHGARLEVENQKSLVEQEMLEHTRRGELWTNGQCKAWMSYMGAMAVLYSLRDKYMV